MQILTGRSVLSRSQRRETGSVACFSVETNTIPSQAKANGVPHMRVITLAATVSEPTKSCFSVLFVSLQADLAQTAVPPDFEAAQSLGVVRAWTTHAYGCTGPWPEALSGVSRQRRWCMQPCRDRTRAGAPAIHGALRFRLDPPSRKPERAQIILEKIDGTLTRRRPEQRQSAHDVTLVGRTRGVRATDCAMQRRAACTLVRLGKESAAGIPLGT